MNSLEKAARRVIAAELRSYDLLSRPAKIRYEHRISEAINDGAFSPEHGYCCAHQISLCSPCVKCERSVKDCKVYQVALESKLRELLSQLKPS